MTTWEDVRGMFEAKIREAEERGRADVGGPGRDAFDRHHLAAAYDEGKAQGAREAYEDAAGLALYEREAHRKRDDMTRADACGYVYSAIKKRIPASEPGECEHEWVQSGEPDRSHVHYCAACATERTAQQRNTPTPPQPLPCPWCGGSAESRYTLEDGYFWRCTGCQMHGPPSRKQGSVAERESLSAWNRVTGARREMGERIKERLAASEEFAIGLSTHERTVFTFIINEEAARNPGGES